MTSAEWAVLGVGLAMIAISAPWHLGGLLLIERLKPAGERRPFLAIVLTFWLLVLLHLSEIAFGAGAYALVMQHPDAGEITHSAGSTAAGLLYFSGVSFTTLAFTSQQAIGPIRLLVMMESLMGFMLITWSATFVYAIWSDRFRSSARDGGA